MSKRPNQYTQDRFVVAYDHAEATADTNQPLMVATRKFRIDAARYVNPTGLAEDADNFFDIQILKDAAVAANWSTETGEEGTLTAGEWAELSLSATAANLVFEAGDEMDLNLDETGTATLPAGRIVLECSYL